MTEEWPLWPFLLLCIFVIWFFFFRETEAQKQARREEEARRADELRKEREAARLAFDTLVSPGVPSTVNRVHREFLAENPLPRGQRWYGEDISPLTFYGYRVGKTRGLPELERHEIIRYVMRARLSEPLAQVYQSSWGRPLSHRRRSAICGHLDKLAAQRATRRNYETAVAEWEADSKWAERHMSDDIKRFDRFGFD